MKKEDFAFNEISALSIQAAIALLRTVYITQDLAQRKKWRNKVRGVLRKLKDSEIKDNIECIRKFIYDTSDEVLQNGKLSFGIAQKIVNIFLKYCWSLGWKKEAPLACPIDSYILKSLRDSGFKETLKQIPVWSKMQETDYKIVLSCIEEVSKGNPAEWELKEWEGLIQ